MADNCYYDGTNWILSAMNGPSMGVKGYYFSTSKSYIKFTNGLIIQWGTNGKSNTTVSFPTNFTQSPAVLGQPRYSSNAASQYWGWIYSISISGFKLDCNYTGTFSGDFSWIAIGY